MDIAIETSQLSKKFDRPRGWQRLARQKPTTAVDDVNLSVRRGELFGLLGPNGAGKTTLVKVLCTLISPTSGTATVAGHPLQHASAIRGAVGLVVADERSFYWRLTGRQNLTFFAAMYGLHGAVVEARIAEVLEAVGMTERADQPFSNYSTGMKQRIAISRSLLHRPQILFLDEPTRSLDPVATQRLHHLILQLVEHRGVTVFLITHNLAEAEKLCHRVAVMDRGRIRVVGHPVSLRDQLSRSISYTVRVDGLEEEAGRLLRQLAPDLQMEKTGRSQHISFQASEADGKLTAILDFLRQKEVAIYSIEGVPPTLENVFAHYIEDDGA